VVGAETVVGGERQSDRGVHARDLFDDRLVVHVRESRTGVLFRKQHAQESELPELAEDLARELLRLVPSHDVGADLGLEKVAQRLQNRLALARNGGGHAEVLKRPRVRLLIGARVKWTP